MARMARAEVFAPEDHGDTVLPWGEKTLGTLKQFRFAESVRLMTAAWEDAKASQEARNHKFFVVALPENA